MFELLVLLGVACLALCVLGGVLQLLVSLVLLPFKLALGLAKGLFGLIFVVPLLLVLGLVFTGIFPLILGIVAVPVFLGVALLAGLFRLIF